MDRHCRQRRTRKNSRFENLVSVGSFILVGALTSPGANASEVLIDRVAASVNGKAVLYSDIQKKLNRGQEIIVTEYPAAKTASPYDRSLQDQINFQLILQKAEQLDIQVDDDKLDQAIKQFISERQMSMDVLRESLRREGMSFEEYREDFRNQLILREFHGRVIYPNVKIVDKNVEDYYLQKNGRSTENISLKLDQLQISGPDSGVVRQQADAAYAALKSGNKFADVVKKVQADRPELSVSSSNFEVKLNEVNPALKPKLEGLSTGETTPPFELDGKIVLFYLNDRTLTGSSDYAAQKPQLENELRAQESGEQTIRWLADQRRNNPPIVNDENPKSKVKGAPL